MPFGLKPQCCCCEATTATIWKRNEKDEIVCIDCMTQGSGVGGEKKEATSAAGDIHFADGNGGQASSQHVLRKSTRARASKQRPSIQPKPSVPKGKGRRIIFKKSATKAPTAVATVVTTSSVFHKGNYYQIGDIVSMVDVQGGIYYAQIRGLLQDQYCEKSAVITWLLPTETSPEPEDGFDPATYIIGPEEDIPRRLDCMEFVCHAPSEYFKARNSPYPTEPQKPELGFIWSRMRPQIKQLRSKDDSIFDSIKT